MHKKSIIYRRFLFDLAVMLIRVGQKVSLKVVRLVLLRSKALGKS